MNRSQVSGLAIPQSHQRNTFGFHQVDFGGSVFIEKADVFLVCGWDRILGEDEQERIVKIVFLVRYAGAGFEFALFRKWIWELPADKILIRVNQGVLDQKLIEVIPQELIIGPPQLVGQTQFFAVLPECQGALLSMKKHAVRRQPFIGHE
jgi:hypothetical protein